MCHERERSSKSPGLIKPPFFLRVLQQYFFSLVVDIAQTIKNRAFNHTHNHTLATKIIYEHFSSSPRCLPIGVDAECLELSWSNSKPTPCLLARPTYQATSHHATAAACLLNARAPLGVTHHTNERARETSTTAPPCPLPTRSTRGTRRAITNEPGFVSRVFVARRVVGGVFGSSTEEANDGRHRGRK